MLKPGDVVKAHFLYADRSGAKIRPALVLSTEKFTKETGDIVLAAISRSSVKNQFEYAIQDWKEANLHFPSKVRVGVVTTIYAQIVKKIGFLSSRDLKQAIEIYQKIPPELSKS